MFSLRLRLPETDRGMLVCLLIITLLSRILPLASIPFIQDESIYAMMVEEQLVRPGLIPTFLGHMVSWKPPLFFWAYAPAAFVPGVSEAAYRLPSLLFGLGTVALCYRLLRNSGISRNVAGLSMLIFTVCFFTVYPHSTLLTDSMAFFLISLSLWLYSEENLGRNRFIAAALAAFAAFFVKLVVAFMVPLLAVAYFYSFRKKTLADPIFLFSLAAVPLAFSLHFLLLSSAGLSEELYGADVGGHVVSAKGLEGQLNMLSGSFITIMITGSIIWLSFAVYGFIHNWRKNIFMSAWFLLTIIPLFTAALLPWYYLPVMPAIGYFAALPLITWKGREKIDAVFWAFLSFLLIIVIAVTISNYLYYYRSYYDHREAGNLLSGEEGVLFIGKYVPGVIAYKTLPEYNAHGRPLDFGWVIFPQHDTYASNLTPFYGDYHYDGVPVTEGSFSSLFTKETIFRKETNLSSFRYVAVLEVSDFTLPYKAIFNKSNITIYEVGPVGD